MDFNLGRFIAIFLGYAVPISLWYMVSRKVPRLWPESARIELDRPKLDLLAAVGAVILIILLNIVYNLGWLFSSAGLLGPLAFPIDLVIIWSPIALVLLWRKQSLGTCLLSLRSLHWKLAWAVVGSVVGMAVFLLVEGRSGELPLAVTLLGKFDPIQMLQSVIQFFGVGFLLVRIVGVAGRAVGIGVCAALYGLVKYPYYMTTYGMSFLHATGIIAFSILVAVAVVYIILDRKDVLVMAIVHVFLDLIQNVKF